MDYDLVVSHHFWPFVAGNSLSMVNGGLGSAREPSSEYLRSQAGKWGLNRCHIDLEKDEPVVAGLRPA